MRWMRPLAAVLAVGFAIAPAAAASAATDGVNDFTFSSFDATYTLSRAADGTSRLHTVETLVAEFPDIDQNHGIRRELVDSYQGHPTDLEIVSVTDENGTPRSYETESNDGFLDVTIAADDFVHGSQTYVITYDQSYVTDYFADSGDDEFYWDTNGTGWKQPFGRVTARIILDPDLIAALTGDASAVRGVEGSMTPATITRTDDGFAVEADGVSKRENVTVAIGFAPGTFAARPDGFFDAAWPSLSAVGALLALVGLVLAVRARRGPLRDAPGRPTIIVEYAPPAAGVRVSSVLLSKTAKLVPAMMLALAVAGNARIVEVESGRKPGYVLEFVHVDGLDVDGGTFLEAVFGGIPAAGTQKDLKKADTATGRRLAKFVSSSSTEATSRGYRAARWSATVLPITVGIIGAALAILFAFVSFAEAYGGAVPALTLVVGAAAAFAAIALVARVPLTAVGSETRDHLAGLRDYIDLAEEDRIRVLQSAQGAERSGDIVKLYERLLPYAVLFGLEKTWSDVLARHYDETNQPTWYYGTGPFNPVFFATGVSSFTTTTSSSFSSSSGGSSGGFSGGGGGGGGGGGV